MLAAAPTAIQGEWPPPSRDDRSLDRVEWPRPRITSAGQGRPEDQSERDPTVREGRWKRGAQSIDCMSASTLRRRRSWPRGSRRAGSRARHSPGSRRRRASPPCSAGSKRRGARRSPRWWCWKRPGTTGSPWRWPCTRRGIGSRWSTRAKRITSPRRRCGGPRPTRSTRGTSHASLPRCNRHRGRPRRRSTTRCASGWWRATGCSRCAPRRATSATRCCSGPWSSRPCASTSTS